ncbi:RDS/peripherin-like protein xRDS35 [Bicyclus anynana]|uniref:RDS/peripherin-like protein xRDS35 n=1 Tax=Bicyclus anynana TaxID=110368 RepID=A0ABM3LHS2_BICAN|nr:RDS/peripherin-like protein xRDS35 [Bicyclus anynana]
MAKKSKNVPCVIWTACILWIISILSIIWSMLLFFGVGEELFLTGTDFVNACVLLSGIIMLPTHLSALYAIANGETIDSNSKILFGCRLKTCVIWIILVNIIGVLVCLQRMYYCYDILLQSLSKSMSLYRTTPKYKRFIDNLQWSLGCCGLHSYKDWFRQDWHDKVRDYEWSVPNSREAKSADGLEESDSVPTSCCKSGAGISCFLAELGTNTINKEGCGNMMYRIIMISMAVHSILFLFVIALESILLKYTQPHEQNSITGKPTTGIQMCKPRCKYHPVATKNPTKSAKSIKKSKDAQSIKCKNKCCASCRRVNIRNIMPINDKFENSSGSCISKGEESCEIESNYQEVDRDVEN